MNDFHRGCGFVFRVESCDYIAPQDRVPRVLRVAPRFYPDARAMTGPSWKFYEELQRSLSLPDYMSCNVNSLFECIEDSEWIDERGAIVCISNCDSIIKSHYERYEVLIDAFEIAGPLLAEPIKRGEWWDRGPIPLLVFMEVNECQATSGLEKFDESRWKWNV